MGLTQSKPPPPSIGHRRQRSSNRSNHYSYDLFSTNNNGRRGGTLLSSSSRSNSQSQLPNVVPTLPTFFSFQQGSERAQNARPYLAESTPLLGRFRAMPPRPVDGSLSGANGGRRVSASSSLAGKGPQHPASANSVTSGLAEPGWRRSVHVGYGYGALVAAVAEEEQWNDGLSESSEDVSGEEAVVVREVSSRGCCCAGDGRWGRRMGKRLRRFWRRLVYTWVEPKASVVRRVVDTWWSRWGALVVLPALLVSYVLIMGSGIFRNTYWSDRLLHGVQYHSRSIPS